MRKIKQTPKLTIFVRFNKSLFYSFKHIEIDNPGPSVALVDDSYVESDLTRDQLSQVIKLQ